MCHPIRPSPMDMIMNQHAAQQMFGQAETLFKDARVPEQVQAMAQEGVAKSRELYVKSTAAAQEGAKLMTEVAETAWSSTKVLNDKIAQNVTANTAAMFDAAQAMAKAGSLPEVAKLQGEYLQQLVATTSAQAKEFYDLSTRATQHLVETVQAAAGKSMKGGF
jgi:hypothetical protein